MKNLQILIGLFLFVLLSCSKEEATPSISFEKSTYALTKGSIDVKLVVSNLDLSSLSTPVDVPISIGGTAQKGVDYTLSAEKFTLGGSAQSLNIKITAKDNYDAKKDITLSLGNISGYTRGQTPMTTVNLGKKDLKLYSFVKKSVTMSAGAEVMFQLFKSDGSAFVAEEEIKIPVSIDTQNSTAIEGEQFSFEGDPVVVIPIGKNSGSVKLKYIEPVVDDKNIIFLKADLEDKKGFIKGQYDQCKIFILGSYADKIFGSWTMKKFVTDKKAMDDTWQGAATFTQENGFPVFNAEDKITIGEDGFKTSLKSSFKNYFSEQSDITLKNELTLRVNFSTKITLQLLELNNINRYFSAKESSEDKVALLGVRITEEGLLDVYVIDYKSKSFAPELINYSVYTAKKPIATQSGVFLNFLMQKED